MRNILSFGVMMKRCAELLKEKPYRAGSLHSDGISLREFFPCATADPWAVRLRMLNQFMAFELTHPAHAYDATITGRIAGGKLYSTYYYQIRPGTYQSKWFDRFWPMHLPTGCEMGKRKRAVIRNRNGTHQTELTFEGGKRGKYGYLTSVDGDRFFGREFTTCDTDNGRFVCDATEMESVSNGISGEASIGWFPLSVAEDEFFESVAAFPAVDLQAMLSLARKTLDAAVYLVRACPGWRVRLFPAGVAAKWRRSKTIFTEAHDRSEDVTVRTTAALTEYSTVQLPVVLLYHPQSNHLVQMRIPPVGNAFLDFEDPAVRKRSPLVINGISASRQTYTGLLACDLSKGDPELLYPCGAEWQDRDLEQREKKLFNFSRSQDHVLCKAYNCDASLLQGNMHLWVARRPEDVAAMLETEHLLNTLPLC